MLYQLSYTPVPSHGLVELVFQRKSLLQSQDKKKGRPEGRP